jgi:transposase-like protein
MPERYPPETRRQVGELARPETRVKRLAVTFGMSEAAIYTWIKQERIDRGEIDGLSTDQAMELAQAKRRIRHLETEPPALEDADRTRDRDPRLHRAVAQRPTPRSARYRDSDRIRNPPPQRRLSPEPRLHEIRGR